MDWIKIQLLINEPLPECVEKILSWCAYDTIASLRNISCESISQIQRQVNVYFRSNIQELTCCYSNVYKNQSEFELLPGHRDLILALPKYLSASITGNIQHNSTQNPTFSTVLNSMIETALQNANKSKHGARYDDIIRFFSTYIFLLCGRSCYEVLNHNLPLPSTRTICKYQIYFHSDCFLFLLIL